MSIVTYSYKESLLFLLTQPYYVILLKHKSLFTPYFIFTDVTEVFSVYVKITLFCSSQISFILLIYHSLLFLGPAFFGLERFYLQKLIRDLVLVWIVVLFFSNYFIIPTTWSFFLSFQEMSSFKSVSLYFEAKLSEYIDLYIGFYYLCIIYSQLLIILLSFLRYNNMATSSLKKFRKVYYYIFIIITTILTPDIFSQLIISFVIIVFYEVCFFLWIIQHKF